jgi:hypothetical protein
MQPGRKFDGVQISSMGTEAFDRIKHGSDVIERVVEAARPGLMLANVLERLVGQRPARPSPSCRSGSLTSSSCEPPPRHQGIHREAGQKRSLSVRVRQTLQVSAA